MYKWCREAFIMYGFVHTRHKLVTSKLRDVCSAESFAAVFLWETIGGGWEFTVQYTKLIWFFGFSRKKDQSWHVKGTCVKKKLEIEQTNCYWLTYNINQHKKHNLHIGTHILKELHGMPTPRIWSSTNGYHTLKQSYVLTHLQ
jgi:hypothetical protein